MSRKKKSGNRKDATISAKDFILLITAIVNAVRSIIDLLSRFTG